MAESNYKLIMHDDRTVDSVAGGGSSSQVTGQPITGAAAKSKNTLAKTVAKVWGASALVRTGVEATEQIVLRDMGNSQLTAKVGAVNTLIKQGVGIGLAFALGGPVAGGLAIVNTSLSMAMQNEQFEYEKRWEKYGQQLMFERAGASFNQSR